MDDACEYAEPRIDGVEEIWFDDVASARKALNSVEFVRSLRPDLENFTSLSLNESNKCGMRCFSMPVPGSNRLSWRSRICIGLTRRHWN